MEVSSFTYLVLVLEADHPPRQSLFNRVLGSAIASKSIPQGAATTVYACVAPRISTEGMRGAYLSDCGPAQPDDSVLDKNVRKRFWQVSEEQIAEAVQRMGIN